MESVDEYAAIAHTLVDSAIERAMQLIKCAECEWSDLPKAFRPDGGPRAVDVPVKHYNKWAILLRLKITLNRGFSDFHSIENVCLVNVSLSLCVSEESSVGSETVEQHYANFIRKLSMPIGAPKLTSTTGN